MIQSSETSKLVATFVRNSRLGFEPCSMKNTGTGTLFFEILQSKKQTTCPRVLFYLHQSAHHLAIYTACIYQTLAF
jgi:hypothetical protein